MCRHRQQGEVDQWGIDISNTHRDFCSLILALPLARSHTHPRSGNTEQAGWPIQLELLTGWRTSDFLTDIISLPLNSQQWEGGVDIWVTRMGSSPIGPLTLPGHSRLSFTAPTLACIDLILQKRAVKLVMLLSVLFWNTYVSYSPCPVKLLPSFPVLMLPLCLVVFPILVYLSHVLFSTCSRLSRFPVSVPAFSSVSVS